MSFPLEIIRNPNIINQLRAAQYLMGSGVVVLLYDHCLTFHDEVQLIWNAQQSLLKGLFLLQRYMIPVAILISLYATSGRVPEPLSDEFCRGFFVMLLVIGFLAIANSQFLVLLRLWTIWEGYKALIVWSLFGYIISQLATWILIILTFADLRKASYFEPAIQSCFWKHKVTQWPQWIPGLLFELAVFSLALYNAFSRPRLRDREMSEQIYRDGSVYFLVILVLRVTILAVLTALPFYWANLVILLWSFSNITTTRLIMNCRRLTVKRMDEVLVPINYELHYLPGRGSLSTSGYK